MCSATRKRNWTMGENNPSWGTHRLIWSPKSTPCVFCWVTWNSSRNAALLSSLTQRIGPLCLCCQTEAVSAVSPPVELEINGSLTMFEDSTCGRWFDQEAASAVLSPAPWITALRVINTAAARGFELEIYSSAFLILICGGCFPAPPTPPSWSSSFSAAEYWSVRVQETTLQLSEALSDTPSDLCSLLLWQQNFTHTHRKMYYHSSASAHQ